MPRLSGSRNKQYSPLQTTHQRSRHSSWFEAIKILDEKDTEYLVEWAGKDPTTGRQWAASWV